MTRAKTGQAFMRPKIAKPLEAFWISWTAVCLFFNEQWHLLYPIYTRQSLNPRMPAWCLRPCGECPSQAVLTDQTSQECNNAEAFLQCEINCVLQVTHNQLKCGILILPPVSTSSWKYTTDVGHDTQWILQLLVCSWPSNPYCMHPQWETKITLLYLFFDLTFFSFGALFGC